MEKTAKLEKLLNIYNLLMKVYDYGIADTEKKSEFQRTLELAKQLRPFKEQVQDYHDEQRNRIIRKYKDENGKLPKAKDDKGNEKKEVDPEIQRQMDNDYNKLMNTEIPTKDLNAKFNGDEVQNAIDKDALTRSQVVEILDFIEQ